MTCASIFLKERKREFLKKFSIDIIVVTISVHSNRSELQKARGVEKIKWWNTQRQKQKYTLTLQPARVHPQNHEKTENSLMSL